VKIELEKIEASQVEIVASEEDVHGTCPWWRI